MERHQVDAFDEELEAEVRKVLDPGSERRRQVAVEGLQRPIGLGVVPRIVLVSGGIVAALLIVWLVLAAL